MQSSPSIIRDEEVSAHHMDEEEYTKDVIIPLLKHMGYMEVTYAHGVPEFGKDVVFSEYDRFGNKVHYAAQVKVGNISGSTIHGIQGMVSHIINAFEIDFPDLVTKMPVGISHFYVITSGRFVGNAKTILLQSRKLQAYRHRLHFYEGHHIEELQERSYRSIIELCTAELAEIERNKAVALRWKTEIPQGEVPVYRSHNLPSLIDALCNFESPAVISLRQDLEQYESTISAANQAMVSVPVLLAIGRGMARPLAYLKAAADRSVALGDGLTEKLRKTIGDLSFSH